MEAKYSMEWTSFNRKELIRGNTDDMLAFIRSTMMDADKNDLASDFVYSVRRLKDNLIVYIFTSKRVIYRA